MQRDHQASNAQRLVYRKRSCLIVGIPLIMLAVAAIVFLVIIQSLHFPRDFWCFGVPWVLFCLGILFSLSQQLVFDNTLHEISKSSKVLFWNRSVTYRYTDFDSVSWKPRVRGSSEGGGGSTLYPITLTGPQAELRLFEETDLEDVRKITREIGEFTGLEQKHWDAGLLTQGPESAAYAGKLATARRRMSIIGMGPRWRVFRTGTTLKYVQTFEPFVRFIMALFAVSGVVAMLLGLPDPGSVPNSSFWLGGIFFVISLPFLLGRRGVTIDTEKAVVRLWVRLLVPIRSRRYDLSAFSEVGVEQQVEEMNSTPCVVGRILLIGDSGHRIVLFKLVFTDEIRQFASEIAEFTGFPVVDEIENTK